MEGAQIDGRGDGGESVGEGKNTEMHVKNAD